MSQPPLRWEGPLPRHLAIIMDGNGRWARRHGDPRVEGHRAGADAVRAIVRCCRRLGLEALTLYAFSAQNWRRPNDEVAALMRLLFDYVHSERGEILDHQIRFHCIGDLDQLPDWVAVPARALMAASADNMGMVLTLALSYGGREEIVRAARGLAERVASGALAPEAVDEALLDSVMWTAGLPPAVDLLIRTGGEQRVSNFLLWQIAYAELWFTDTLWPDFDEAELTRALRDFGQRERRFGRVLDGTGAEDTPC